MSAKLLVVEADKSIALELLEALEGAQYEVSLCATVFDALNLVDMEPEIAGVVTDVRLADGSSGWDLATAVRERSPQMPIVYVSDCSTDYDGRGVSGSLLIKRPMAPLRIAEAIRELLRRRDGGATGAALPGALYKAP